MDNNKIRILGMDDDNHEPMFVAETGEVFYDAQELIQILLAKPHLVEYEVKMFALVDGWSTALLEYDECEVDNMFDFLCRTHHLESDAKFSKIFELFWESANRKNW